jgi:hypothetical protein
VPLLTPSNVIGGMCEICYNGHNSRTGLDYVHTGTRWINIENAEIQTIAKHKIFWAYPRAIGVAQYASTVRKYAYASFLLSYNPTYAMIQEALKTNNGFEVFPETGLVPMNPLTTASSVTGYLRSGGAYMREFGACYYRGVNKGKCAVVVNPTSGTVTVPTTAYGHSLGVVGSDVLEGGYVTFTGSRPSSLPSGTAAILFQ